MDIFYKMSGLTINGISVSPSNVDSFELNKRYESEIADIYSSSPRKRTGVFIIHIKRPDLYSKNNSFLLDRNFHKSQPEVDWTEESLQESIDYIDKRL